MQKLKTFIKKAIRFLLNPRFVLSFGIAWMITNGWAYILLAVGTFWDIPVLQAIGGGYITFLWLPISPEKIITVAISIWVLKKLFPDDTDTLAVLAGMHNKIKSAARSRKCKKSASTSKTEE
ncbi:MAG: hypothetical protein IJE90_00530 [Clostridia bacterium]|nr:hypothetical protein [Clostridia bacterium]